MRGVLSAPLVRCTSEEASAFGAKRRCGRILVRLMPGGGRGLQLAARVVEGCPPERGAGRRRIGLVLARLGADQYVQLTTCIGYYAMLAMTVNGAELPPNPKHEALEV